MTCRMLLRQHVNTSMGAVLHKQYTADDSQCFKRKPMRLARFPLPRLDSRPILLSLSAQSLCRALRMLTASVILVGSSEPFSAP